jgi:hypothetical protein
MELGKTVEVSLFATEAGTTGLPNTPGMDNTSGQASTLHEAAIIASAARRR